MLQIFRPLARAGFDLTRRSRHAWLRAKPAARARSIGSRVAAPVRRSGRRLTRLRRRADAVLLSVRQFMFYRVPREQRRCPACGSPQLAHLEPLPHHVDAAWRVGFISGCERCGVIFANPLPSADDLEKTYSVEGDWGRPRQDEDEKQVSRQRLERVFAPIATELNVLNPPPDAAVLDFGCGLGGMLDALAHAGWTTYGLDPATKGAFRRHQEVLRVPHEPRFRLVVLHHVLEHVTAPLAILKQLARATLPGGFVLISVPNLDGLGEHGDFSYCIRSQVHVLAYTRRSLEWLCVEAGFRPIGEPGELAARKCIILARREAESAAHPAAPLDAARRALRAFHARHAHHVMPLPLLPVRLRAAVANAQRLRRPKPC